jgi:uncharacterized protein YcfJ
MTEHPVVPGAPERPIEVSTEGSEPPAEPPVDELEDGLIAGRPVEDRSFEVLEVAAGASLGIAIGAVVAGPVGAGIGGVVGAAAGLVAGESIEHAVGHAAETTDATDHEPGRSSHA